MYFIYRFDINHTHKKKKDTQTKRSPNAPKLQAHQFSPRYSFRTIESKILQEPNKLISFFFSPLEKPWPIIERFLQNLEPGSVGLDVGCGNGKYLAVNRDVFIVASDR
jgi:tRNA (uracil-5-)-methyltransferase TRM9